MLDPVYFSVFLCVMGAVSLLLLMLLAIRREQIKRNKKEGYFIFLFEIGETSIGKIRWEEIKKIARQKEKKKIKFTLVEFDDESITRFKRDFSRCSELWASAKAVFKE